MNSNERFGQIEAMLADLLRRMDRQAEQMDRQAEQMDRQAERMDRVIDILKLSDERQTRAEERQDAMLTEIRQIGQRTDTNQASINANQDHIRTLLTAQQQLLDLMVHSSRRTDLLEIRTTPLLTYEARFQRLEDAVFNKAS